MFRAAPPYETLISRLLIERGVPTAWASPVVGDDHAVRRLMPNRSQRIASGPRR